MGFVIISQALETFRQYFQPMSFFTHILLTVFWIYGVNCVFAEGFIFERVGDWIADRVPQWVTKPLFDCPACMSSVHGTISFFIFNGDFMLWPVFCVCVCGVSYIILKFLKKNEHTEKDLRSSDSGAGV